MDHSEADKIATALVVALLEQDEAAVQALLGDPCRCCGQPMDAFIIMDSAIRLVAANSIAICEEFGVRDPRRAVIEGLRAALRSWPKTS